MHSIGDAAVHTSFTGIGVPTRRKEATIRAWYRTAVAVTSLFGGHFPFATRCSPDVPALLRRWALNETRAEFCGEVEGVTRLGAGAPATSTP